MKARTIIILAQVLVTVLYLINYQGHTSTPDTKSFVLSLIPLALVGLIIINSFWCTRFVSWLIFSGAFFGFMITLSAFTLRWRLEPGFNTTPFYRSIIMYVCMVYISLGQMKLHFKYMPDIQEEKK